VARIAALGATIDSPVADVGGGILVAVLLDPYGNQFGVVQNPHFDLAKVR
jgi:predicted enzyme related to lactoylglutathione lyase